jgi:hypothetical protein
MAGSPPTFAVMQRRCRSARAAKSIAAAALLALGVTASAEGVSGRVALKFQVSNETAQSLSAAVGVRSRNDAIGDLRLAWETRRGGWGLSFEDHLSFDAGGTPALTAREAALGIFEPGPPATWLNLDDKVADRPHLSATQSMDRLFIGHTSAHLVVRVGRQALTWGAGLVFHPLDLIDPFAPNATDTEYKPGTDMVYAQVLFDSGSDLQLATVPRSPNRGGRPTWNASSAAMHYHAALDELQSTWIAARDRGDGVAAVGVNGAIGGATWNAELISTFIRDAGTAISAIANISDAVVVFGRNETVFAEVYRNGFGVARRHYSWSDLPAPLRDRLARGQVFDTGKDYLAAGADVEWTPLLRIKPTLIANLGDGGLLALVQATYSVHENVDLVAGVQIPLAARGTEFGGIPLAAGGSPLIELPRLFFVQLRAYF